MPMLAVGCLGLGLGSQFSSCVVFAGVGISSQAPWNKRATPGHNPRP